MNNSDKFASAINEYVNQYGSGAIKSIDEILDIAKMSDKKGSILPSDFCYNRYNTGLGDFGGHHLFEYVERNKYKILGENYPYSGYVYHKPKGKAEIIIASWENGKLRMNNIEK